MIRRLFGRKTQPELAPEPGPEVGVRNSSDRVHRAERIGEYVKLLPGLTPQKAAELTAHLDKWIIHTASTGGRTTFIPAPGWEDEVLLTRTSFGTLEEARAAVNDAGGALYAGGSA